MNEPAPELPITVDGPVCTVVMNRPPVNALDDALVTDLHVALDRVEEADAAVVVFRSATKVFCAGADLGFIRSCFGSDEGIDDMIEYVRSLHVLFDRIEALGAVTIAVVEGPALGGGLELTLACDLRLVSTSARIGLPEARVGMIPGAGGTQRLTRLCGPGVSSRLILAADMIDGNEAHRLGIAQWVAEPDRIDNRLAELTATISTLSRPALLASKSCVAAADDPSIDGYARELEQPARLMRTAEARALIEAFFASRTGS